MIKQCGRTSACLLALIILTLLPAVAAAHTGHATGGFIEGLLHPLTGLDHLLALLGAGLWARFQTGATCWAMPASFLGALLVGAGVAGFGLALPAVELGIGASVLILGLLVATATAVPLRLAAALAASFAVFHGYAHIAEITAGVTAGVYAVGFVATSAAGIGAGFALGTLIDRQANRCWNRVAGASIAGAGALFLATSLVALVG